MNSTNSRFYDSTFYNTAKSKFSKPSEVSSSQNNFSTLKTKGFFEVKNLKLKLKNYIQINNSKEINDSLYGYTNTCFNITNNKFDRTKFSSQEKFFRKTHMSENKQQNKNNKEKKREVTFNLIGNVKLNTLVNPKKYFKDYFIRYVTKSINSDSINKNKSQNEIYEKYNNYIN